MLKSVASVRIKLERYYYYYYTNIILMTFISDMETYTSRFSIHGVSIVTHLLTLTHICTFSYHEFVYGNKKYLLQHKLIFFTHKRIK